MITRLHMILGAVKESPFILSACPTSLIKYIYIYLAFLITCKENSKYEYTSKISWLYNDKYCTPKR